MGLFMEGTLIKKPQIAGEAKWILTQPEIASIHNVIPRADEDVVSLDRRQSGWLVCVKNTQRGLERNHA
jgi:hypothetical protein